MRIGYGGQVSTRRQGARRDIRRGARTPQKLQRGMHALHKSTSPQLSHGVLLSATLRSQLTQTGAASSPSASRSGERVSIGANTLVSSPRPPFALRVHGLRELLPDILAWLRRGARCGGGIAAALR